MQRSFQPVKTTIVLTAAMLLACVPASASVLTLDDGATHNLDSAVAEDDVEVYNSTTANLLTGGTIGGTLDAYDDSTVNVSGGTISVYLQSWGNSEVNVSGGTIGQFLEALDDSTVNVSGGSIGLYLTAYDTSTVTIFGTFDIFGYDGYDDGSSLDGATLTGTLADGTDIDHQVNISGSGTVILAAPVPEPSSIAMFGIGAVGLLGYSRRRRQTSAAACPARG